MSLLEKPTRIYQCENTIDGIFSAIYEAGISGYGHKYIRIQPLVEGEAVNLELFSEYISVETDSQKTEKVLKAIYEKISPRAYSEVMWAIISEEADRGDVIYQFITYGFTMGDKVCDALQIPAVKRIFAMRRKVANEAHFFREFLRFKEVRTNPSLLLAVIEPQNHILPMLMKHFTDRFAEEWFIVYDKTHKEAAFHQRKGEWEIRLLTEEEAVQLEELNEQREDYVDLWKTFFDHIVIQERINTDLQRNMLPLHYRKHMTEFVTVQSQAKFHKQT